MKKLSFVILLTILSACSMIYTKGSPEWVQYAQLVCNSNQSKSLDICRQYTQYRQSLSDSKEAEKEKEHELECKRYASIDNAQKVLAIASTKCFFDAAQEQMINPKFADQVRLWLYTSCLGNDQNKSATLAKQNVERLLNGDVEGEPGSSECRNNLSILRDQKLREEQEKQSQQENYYNQMEQCKSNCAQTYTNQLYNACVEKCQRLTTFRQFINGGKL